MFTVQEIESARIGTQTLEFARHALELPALAYRKRYFPLGFPVELRSNSTEVVLQSDRLWSSFECQFDTPPIVVDVHVVQGTARECPPAPRFHMSPPRLINIADGDNWSIADLDESISQVVLTQDALKYPSYVGYYFLGSAPLCHIACTYATPVHAACVSFEGRGMLLCGDSGAGKSSLAYACARAGWTYIADDASYLPHTSEDRVAIGNCHQVRFRPSAADLFPEVEGMEATPRAAGKPSVEMATGQLPWMRCAPSARVESVVFLNRSASGSPALLTFRREVARSFLRQVLYGTRASLEVQFASIDRLLTADVFELRYGDLDWAVHRLGRLARDGK